MEKLLFALLFVGVFATNAQTKQQTIWGTISDGITPIQGVNVTLAGSNEGNFSDAKGKYRIHAKPAEIIEFSYVGMKTVRIRVEDVTSSWAVSTN